MEFLSTMAPASGRGRPVAARVCVALLWLPLAVSIGTGDAAASECSPAAVVSGDADLVQEASLALRRAGIGLEGTEACPAAMVTLRREGGLISVRCSDPVGRSVSRTVATVDEAVSVIESWAQPEANAAWMAGWTVETLAPEVPAKEIAPPGTKESEPTGALVSTGWTGDLLWDGDGSTWMGTTLTLCMSIGPFCGGGAAEVRGSPSLGLAEVGALASLELPLRAGRWEVSPGIGVGGARGLRSGSRGSDDNGGGDDWRLRGEGRLRVSYAIAAWLALDLAFAAEASPAHTSTSHEDKFDDNPHVVSSDPTFFLRTGAGLRVSIP